MGIYGLMQCRYPVDDLELNAEHRHGKRGAGQHFLLAQISSGKDK